jgi:hypothetical protein
VTFIHDAPSIIGLPNTYASASIASGAW